ncbi:MAG: hypothetical protein EZS28_038575, partial [Streblomastix strix]
HFYVDTRTKKVIVRYQEDVTEINLQINRQEPRLTLLGAIPLSNEALILLIILKGDNFRDTWIPPGIITGIYAEFSCTTNSYITIPVWISWLQNILVLWTDAVRKHLRRPHAPGILMCDNLTSHCNIEARQYLAANNVKLITIPPHSSKFLQTLDVISFANFKGAIRQTREMDADMNLHDIIRHSINVCQVSTSFLNCRASFEKAGLHQNFDNLRPQAEVIPGFFDKQVRTRRDIVKYDQNAIVPKKRGRKPTPFGYINELKFNEESKAMKIDYDNN